MRIIFGILALFIFSFFIPLGQVFAVTDNTSKLVILELKIDGDSSSQFVSLYNAGSQANSPGEFKLEYARHSYIGPCDQLWSLSGGNTRVINESITPGEYISIPISFSMLDNDGGSFRITDSSAYTIDLVSWDRGSSMAPCPDNPAARSVAPWAGNNQSIRRYIDCGTSLPIDTDKNGLDFYLANTNTSILDNCPIDNELSEEVPEDETDDEGGLGAGPNSSCSGLIINELLVNPAGSDDDEEYIEIFNPSSSPIPLDGCKLQTSANSKFYTFPESIVAPGQFVAFYSSQTGLTLANSSGGSVFLIDSDNSELVEVSYPVDLEDDKSWSLIDGSWQQTFSLTPSAINQLLAIKPCPEGQFRNPETNRCNNIILTAAGLSDCKPGQTRNLETNRCRNAASLASSLKACASDQYRNPETNRCKSINAASGLAPCKEGQERNPETNRCRNVAGLTDSNSDNQVTDLLSGSTSTQVSWLFAAGSLLGALLYGAWEWRNDLTLYALSLKSRIS